MHIVPGGQCGGCSIPMLPQLGTFVLPWSKPAKDAPKLGFIQPSSLWLLYLWGSCLHWSWRGFCQPCCYELRSGGAEYEFIIGGCWFCFSPW